MPPRRPTPSPDFYRQLFDAHPVPLWVYDLESLAFLAVNDAAVEQYGYSCDEFLAMTIEAIRPAEDVAPLRENISHVTEGLDHAGVWRHLRKDGSLIDVEITSHVVDWEGVRAELVMAIDVTARRRAEITLRNSEQRFARGFRSSPALMTLARVSDKVLLDVSDSFARATGYTRDELVGHTSGQLQLWADPAEGLRVARALAAKGSLVDQQVHLRTRGGEVRELVAAYNLIDVNGEVCVLGTAIDVTDRRAAELLVARQREQLQHLLDSSPTTLYALRTEGDAFVPTLVGDNVRRVLGFTPDEVRQEGFFARHVHPDDVESIRTTLPQLFERDSLAHEYRFRHRDGVYRWLRDEMRVTRREGGRPIEVTGSWFDVTDLHRANDALRESERRFRALIENASDAIALVDARGRFRYVSPTTQRVLGYSPEELAGIVSFDLVHPADRKALAALFAECAARPGAVVAGGGRGRHRDGSWRLLEGRLTNLLDDPSVGAIVVNYRDVTEQRRVEEQLQQSQRLESIGRLAGGVAHDFNNLLTAILGYAELLEENVGDGDALEAVGEIRRAGERARELTRQLLTFARRQMISPRPVDLNEIVSSTRRLIDRLIGEQVLVETRLAEGLWHLEADPVQLEQVILNLAINARDAMPSGGTLTIETANVELDPMAGDRRSQLVPGPYVRLKVSDTGTGIPAEMLSSIFEPFFTTKPAGEGTGLGLATVHGAVHRVGGHIHVASEIGRGTTFTLHFPRSSAPRLVEIATPTSNAPGEGETILLVEDDDTVRAMMERVLRGAGYRVLVAARGAQALALADSETSTIDLLLTDVVMPGMSGRQVAEAIVARSPATKVLYSSGYTRNTMGEHGTLDQAVHFLAKPFTPSALRAKVREVLER